MARISGVDLPRKKRVEVALTYIFGIGPTLSKQIVGKANIDPDTRTDKLTEGQVASLREIIERDQLMDHAVQLGHSFQTKLRSDGSFQTKAPRQHYLPTNSRWK